MKRISVIILFTLIILSRESYAQWLCCDTISFEKPTTNLVIDTLTGNLWQIGKPSKTFFNSAHTGTNAILTDTINSYPQNATSSFFYIIPKPYIQTCFTCMEFWHKYDMDTVADKGIIDASYDGGNSWILVNVTNNNHFSFFWNSDYHESSDNYTQHKLNTSGQSDGWIKSAFCWAWQIFVKKMDTIISPPDSLIVRFTFISDSLLKNKDGWMIDDIIVIASDPGYCSGVDEIFKGNHISVFPNPFNSQTTLQTDLPLNNATLRLYNTLGQQIKQINNITGPSVTSQRGNLPGGMYYFRFIQENLTIATGKLVITNT